MRSVSIGVRDAILNGKRPFIKALVTYRDGFSEWLYDDDFMQNSVQFQNGTSSKGNFEIGAAVIGAFSFNLNNWDHKFDTRNFDGAIISAYIGINPKMFGYALLTEVSEIFTLNDGEVVLETEEAAEQDYSDTTEWFQFGQYYFVKHKSVGNVIVCDAYDAMKLFDESLLTDNSIVYPISAKNLVRMIADHNGITLKNYDFPNGDTVISEAPEDDCTERQMLTYVCQMIGCFARINSTGQLDINWYDDIPATTIMHRFSHSLATEDITITGLRMSYKDVDDQDASSLFLYRKPYKGVLITFDERSATEADGFDYVRIYYKSGNSYKVSAKFGGHDTNNRIAGRTFYIPSNEFWVYWHTDTSQDAFWGWAFTVTPATVVKSETLSTVSSLPAYDIEDLPSDYYPQSEHDGHYGHRIDKVWHCKASYYIDTTKDSGQWIPMSGIEADNTDYVLEISGNPLINASNYEDIEELLADKLIGLTFRHGDMSILANPSFEAGDVVTTFDDKGNRALFLITNIDYSLTVQQTISCDAQEIEKSDLRSIKSTTVARREAKSVIRNEMTAYDTQYMRLTQLMTQSLGFFETKETTPSGGYIYYMHNNPDLHESSIIWKMTENTFTVSTDGGQTWNAGITADGNALVNVLSAKGINADWLNTGSIIVQKNGQTVFLADYDTGVVRIVADEFSLSSGDTIQSIANSAASSAAATAKTEAIQQSTENLNTFINGAYATTISGIEDDITDLQGQIDGNITTWFYAVDPTLSNPPASSWTTTEDKNNHLGDLYYNTESGYCWRWMLEGSTYKWQRITDTDVTKALADAAKAQDTADNKRRVFTSTPTVPYDVGDLWTQGASGDILVCSTAKTESQTYSANDWTRASKYTDDTALTTWINGDYADDLEEIATQIDGKAETFYQTSDPSTSWTSAQKTEHTGDLWYNSIASVQKYYRWNGTAWQELTATPPDEVFDEIDGKAQIFVSQPTTPYNVGDLWFNSATSDIMTCVTARATGNYTASDWEKRNKYTDDSGLSNFVTSVYTPTVNNIQTQIDGKIDTYFMGGTPSASTLPESEWTTTAEKDKHINDLYYDIENNLSYRYAKISGTRITFDSQSETRDYTMDWVEIYYRVDGQLYRLKRPGTNSGQFGGRGSANYIAGISVFIPTYDFYIYWRAATSSNYYGFSLHTEYANDEISDRWTATGLPSDGGTPIELAQGVLPETNHSPYESGYKIWHVTLDSPSTGYSWIKVEDADVIQALDDASKAQDTADGKRRVFVTQPVPPYDIGDLWAQGANGDILKCKTAKSSSGSYNANDWEKASNYVDQATAKDYTIQQMTQTEVFNKLTNNGEVQGVFLQDGQLYINADYIQSGTFTSKKLSDYYVVIDGHYAHQLNILKVGGAEIEFSYSDPEEESTTFGGVTARFEVLQNGDFWGVGAKKSYFGRCEAASYSHRTSFTGMEVGYAPLYHFGDVAFYGNRFSFYKDVSIGDSVTSLKTYVDFYDNSGTLTANFSTDVNANNAIFTSLVVGGTKSRVASTKDYSDRLLYCYETPSPLFGDVGEGVIGDDGNCYVWIDSIFAETVTLNQYQVFLQKYGDGDCYVKERKSSYFVVSGTPGMAFGWELKAKQSDFDQRRLEKFTKDKVNLSTDDYGSMAEAHLAEIKKERGESND